MSHWVGQGVEGIEANLGHSPETGRFCHGDRITMADICVTGLAMIGRVFKLELPRTPVLSGIVDRCLAEEAFARAEPSRQADAPKG